MVTLSIIIPTCDPARPLRRCLASIASQPLLPGDEVIVVGDMVDNPLVEVAALMRDMPPQFIYLPTQNPKGHTWGHEEINLGIEVAGGDYLVFNDDDDVFVKGAFDAIRGAAAALVEPRPMMFRFVTQPRALLWATPEIRYERVGGHNLVTPNIKERLGRWTERYQGDFDFIRSTIDLWPNKDADIVWDERVIAFARPDTQ